FSMTEKLNVGDAIGVIAAADKVVAADYMRPYAAHACMEPMNCTVSITDDRVDIYTSTQQPAHAVRLVAQQLGRKVDTDVVHTGLIGGAFGRRLANDYVRQAVVIAQAVGRPVKLVWTREEDIAQGQMRAMAHARMKAALGPDGLPKALFVRSVG